MDNYLREHTRAPAWTVDESCLPALTATGIAPDLRAGYLHSSHRRSPSYSPLSAALTLLLSHTHTWHAHKHTLVHTHAGRKDGVKLTTLCWATHPLRMFLIGCLSGAELSQAFCPEKRKLQFRKLYYETPGYFLISICLLTQQGEGPTYTTFRVKD